MKAAYDESTPAEAKRFVVYVASKTEGERAAWKWVEKRKPSFVFNAVVPYYTVSKCHAIAPGGVMVSVLILSQTGWASSSSGNIWLNHEVGG